LSAAGQDDFQFTCTKCKTITSIPKTTKGFKCPSCTTAYRFERSPKAASINISPSADNELKRAAELTLSLEIAQSTIKSQIDKMSQLTTTISTLRASKLKENQDYQVQIVQLQSEVLALGDETELLRKQLSTQPSSTLLQPLSKQKQNASHANDVSSTASSQDLTVVLAKLNSDQLLVNKERVANAARKQDLSEQA